MSEPDARSKGGPGLRPRRQVVQGLPLISAVTRQKLGERVPCQSAGCHQMKGFEDSFEFFKGDAFEEVRRMTLWCSSRFPCRQRPSFRSQRPDPLRQQPIHQMRPEKPCPARNHRNLLPRHFHLFLTVNEA